MTECQGCGAWNDSRRTLCVLCGTPLAETDEWDAAADLPPLPPLPDGGLSASMPAWLRDRPEADSAIVPASHGPAVQRAATRAPALASVVATVPPLELQPLSASADPRTFLTDDDFPRWLRDLAAREGASTARARMTGPHEPAAQFAADLGMAGSTWPSAPAPEPPAPPIPFAEASPPSDGRPSAAEVGAHARKEHRPRALWETLLLVILFIGVVVAALWALVSNGVISPGL
jgi:hypothetical protein